MSTLLTRYTFLQETEWAGRSVYRVRDDQAGRELYLIREPVQDSTIASTHPSLPAYLPLTAEGNVRWFTADGVQGESLASLREKHLLPKEEIRKALDSVLRALTHLSTLNPPLVPGTLEPDCIKREETGQWQLDVPALAFTREARLSPGIPAGLNPFGRLLYWLVTGESLRHGTNQAPLQQGVTPMFYFMVMRCLGHAYNSLGYLQQDMDRLWEDPGFLLLIKDLGREATARPAGLPSYLAQRLPEPAAIQPEPSGEESTAQPTTSPAQVTPGPAPYTPSDPTQDASQPPCSPSAAIPARAWGPPPPAHVRRTVDPDEGLNGSGPSRSRDTVHSTLRLPLIAVGSALVLLVGGGTLFFALRSSAPKEPEAARPAIAEPATGPAATPALAPVAVAETATDRTELALLQEVGAFRKPEAAKEPDPAPSYGPVVRRPTCPPPAITAVQPGTHQAIDMEAGGSPTWISLDGVWKDWAYVFYIRGAQFVSMDAFNGVFGHNLTWAENGINSYAIFDNGRRLITGDATAVSKSRLWLKLTPDMQWWLGVQLQSLDTCGMHFRAIR